MKKLIIFGLFFIFWHDSFGQLRENFKLLRQDEDYSYLKDDTSRSWYKNMKYTRLGNKDSYLSTGGGIRHQVFYYKNENWGETQDRNDGYIFSRFLFHGDLHVRKNFRTFIQLQSSLATGKATTSPVDENTLDLQQAFFDFYLPAGNDNKFTLRVGRQELSYGAERLVSVGEGPNNRQAFDAIKANFKAKGVSADLFYSHQVKDQKAIFDDQSNEGVKFFGSYFKMKDVPLLKDLELYYFGLRKRNTAFDDGEGREFRHSVGSRISGNTNNWRYDFEGVYQFGKFSNKAIRAWTFSSNIGYQFKSLRFQPEIGLKSELISGDRSYDDNKLQTFNPLFPRGAYFGLAALIGPANLFDIHPSIKLTLVKDKLTATIDYDAFWRLSKNDGVYAPNATLIYSGRNTESKFIGQQYLLHLDYTPTRFLSFTLESTWFHPQGFLKEASPGKDILFFGFTSQLTF